MAKIPKALPTINEKPSEAEESSVLQHNPQLYCTLIFNFILIQCVPSQAIPSLLLQLPRAPPCGCGKSCKKVLKLTLEIINCIVLIIFLSNYNFLYLQSPSHPHLKYV